MGFTQQTFGFNGMDPMIAGFTNKNWGVNQPKWWYDGMFHELLSGKLTYLLKMAHFFVDFPLKSGDLP